jgi:hypothetical protein
MQGQGDTKEFLCGVSKNIFQVTPRATTIKRTLQDLLIRTNRGKPVMMELENENEREIL